MGLLISGRNKHKYSLKEHFSPNKNKTLTITNLGATPKKFRYGNYLVLCFLLKQTIYEIFKEIENRIMKRNKHNIKNDQQI